MSEVVSLRLGEKPERVSQQALLRAVLAALEEQGVTAGNHRQLNAVVKACDDIADAFGRPHEPARAGMGLDAWLRCDETGTSSRYLASVLAPLAGLGRRHCRDDGPEPWPHDPSDFARCVGLLDAEPSLRRHLPAMRDEGPQWSALAAEWDALEALYREELSSGKAPKLYARLRGLLDAAAPASAPVMENADATRPGDPGLPAAAPE